MMDTTRWLTLLLITALAAGWDVRSGRIPNALTIPTCLLGWSWLTWSAGVIGLADALAGSVIASGPFILLWLIGVSGAGDAKLMAAVGAMLGVGEGLVALAAVAIVGGALALAWASARGQFTFTAQRLFLLAVLPSTRPAVKTRRQTSQTLSTDRGADNAMPYGLAIFLGTFAVGVIRWGLI
jgi:prepilin peptidase CpaA